MNAPLSELHAIPALSPTDAAEAAPMTGCPGNVLHVVHLLRRCDPAEWGGTEAAAQRLLRGLAEHAVSSVVYCPRLERGRRAAVDPLTQPGCRVERFRAFLPTFGLSRKERERLISVGGNLMSLDLPLALWREPAVSVIHTHTLGRLGAIAGAVAERRRIPFVVTIHGGLLDGPALCEPPPPAARGWEWGRIFGFLFRSRTLLERADAILTCNPKEAALLGERHPHKRILVQPHGVPARLYQRDHRRDAWAAFPQIRGRELLVCVGRIDPVKNQRWLIEEMPSLLRRHPRAQLVLAGACTDEVYGDSVRNRIFRLNLGTHVLLTGGLPPDDPRLIGLLQEARLVVLPSISETFGLVILEAWAAGTAVAASRTSGALALVRHDRNGWLFDLKDARGFHAAVDAAFLNAGLAAQLAADGQRLVHSEYDDAALARRLRDLYVQLLNEMSSPLMTSPRASSHDPMILPCVVDGRD